MSSFKIGVANFFAKHSCAKWEKHRAVRKACRAAYRFLMEFGAREYPYESLDFAPWPESDEEGEYTLISDSQGFVIRRSPSYVAWMMKRATGKWPERPEPGEREPGEHAFDAKHWDELLSYNGWIKLEDGRGPGLSDVLNGYHFVGVIADEGEFGQVVWFNSLDMHYDRVAEIEYPAYWVVRTYRGFQKKMRLIPTSEGDSVVWWREP